MTDQVFSNLPQTPPPEPPADALAQKEPAEALIPAQEMAGALSAPEVETPDVSDSPFCRAMGLIAGGLAVTGVTLNFWNLDMLLPLVGTFCLLVGFRALRRVNGFLRAGYVCACLHMLLLFVELGQDAAVCRETAAADTVSTALAFGSAAVQFVRSSAFGKACSTCSALSAERRPLLPPRARCCSGTFCSMSQRHCLPRSPCCSAFTSSGISTWSSASTSSQSRWPRRAAPSNPVKERFSNPKLVGSLLAVLAVVIACGFLFFSSYRMDWTPKEASTDAQVIEAYERLLALGYPESELNDLSDEDLLTCLRAERVLVRKCTSGGYTNYNGKSQTNDAFHMTVVAVERPFGRLFLSYHFRWDEGTHFYGTESFAVEPNCDTGSWLAEEFSGRVFYDSPDGTTYTAPYIDPGTEQASLSNWYENCFRQLYCADLSFPNSGTNRRGYIACSLHPLSDDASRLNGQFYYVHQSSRFQYPIQTAREYQDFNVDKHRRSYAPFERMQDYFVLLRNEDGVWRIRQ